LARELRVPDFTVVAMNARRTADAMKAPVPKANHSDARILAEMLRTD